MPDVLTIPVGAFADPQFPHPGVSIHGERQHAWLALAGDIACLD